MEEMAKEERKARGGNSAQQSDTGKGAANAREKEAIYYQQYDDNQGRGKGRSRGEQQQWWDEDEEDEDEEYKEFLEFKAWKKKRAEKAAKAREISPIKAQIETKESTANQTPNEYDVHFLMAKTQRGMANLMTSMAQKQTNSGKTSVYYSQKKEPPKLKDANGTVPERATKLAEYKEELRLWTSAAIAGGMTFFAKVWGCARGEYQKWLMADSVGREQIEKDIATPGRKFDVESDVDEETAARLALVVTQETTHEILQAMRMIEGVGNISGFQRWIFYLFQCSRRYDITNRADMDWVERAIANGPTDA